MGKLPLVEIAQVDIESRSPTDDLFPGGERKKSGNTVDIGADATGKVGGWRQGRCLQRRRQPVAGLHYTAGARSLEDSFHAPGKVNQRLRLGSFALS